VSKRQRLRSVLVMGWKTVVQYAKTLDEMRAATDRFTQEIPNADYDYDAQVITVAPGLSPQSERESILHEAIHSLSSATHSGLKEKQVYRMARALDGFLSDNPRFRALYDDA